MQVEERHIVQMTFLKTAQAVQHLILNGCIYIDVWKYVNFFMYK